MITLTCKYCGDDFEEYPSKSDKKFCSRSCWSDSSRTEKSCQFCNDAFWTYNSENKKFCSEGCYKRNKRKNIKEVECEFCGDGFNKPLGQIRRYPTHFCSKSCAGKSRTGPDANGWKGGDYIYDRYGPNWKEQRKKALDRDGYACAICGEDEKRLEVHHIESRRELYNKELQKFDPSVNDLCNLVTLCVDHHSPLEGEFSNCEYQEFVDRAKDLLA